MDVSEVPKSGAWRKKISAVSNFRSLSSKPDSDNNPLHVEITDEEKAGLTKKERRLNRSKLLAITSFSKLGKHEIDLIELESDFDQEEEADKKEVLSLTDNIRAASECKKDENLRNIALQPSDPDMKSEQERINPDIYSKHYEEARIEENPAINSKQDEETRKEEEESLSENVSNGSSEKNVQQEALKQVPASSNGGLNLPETEKEQTFSQSDFDKSRNSRTAAMFQRHGKLLEANTSAAENSVKGRVKDKKSTMGKNIFSCCLCRKK